MDDQHISSALRRAPNVVAIGGGHGLSRTLQAAKLYANTISAIVTVADNGGSSQTFKDELSIPALGDIRRCLVSLSDADSLLAMAMSYRFQEGAFTGHPVGNFVLAALYKLTSSLELASKELGNKLAASGIVLPACDSNVTLIGTTVSGEEIIGQVAIMDQNKIFRVRLAGENTAAPAMAIQAIKNADQILIGPGSLYTSLLAALTAGGIADAIKTSKAQKIYVANLCQQQNETSDYTLLDHLQALTRHGIDHDITLVPTETELGLGDMSNNLKTVQIPLADELRKVHNPFLLGAALENLWRNQS